MSHFLSGRTIALSVSTSPDLTSLGLTQMHLNDALVEIARHLIAEGAQLIYCGDLREGGFTELLLELAYRHTKDLSKPILVNPLPWPVHAPLPWNELEDRAKSVSPAARVEFLDPQGLPMTPEERSAIRDIKPLTEEDWKFSLTNMRESVINRANAIILLGGQVSKFKGKMPGVAEEAVMAIKAKLPIYIAGGFGGCSRDIAMALKIIDSPHRFESVQWDDNFIFKKWQKEDLHNHLAPKDNSRLATTSSVDEIAALILRGLYRAFAVG